MNKFAVIVFENEAKAYEGTRVLAELHGDGSIVLFSEAVIAKDPGGAVSLKDAATGGPQGAAVGALTGGLIGLLGGPVGAMLGLAGGALIGSYGDLLNAGVSADFVRKVADALKPGTTAIVAEISEDWAIPLDTRMLALGGRVLRTYRSDSDDDRLVKEIAGQTDDIQRLKAEFAEATGDAKKQLEQHLAAANLALEETVARAKTKSEVLKAEVHAKIHALSEQAADAASDIKARIDQRIVKANAEYEARSAKLNQAWGLTKDALS